MEVVVERVGRSGAVLERQRFSRLPVSLGRAYRNDVILTDPFVDAFHGELGCDENGELSVRDINSRNGIQVAGSWLRSTSQPLESGETLTLGKSHLRVFRADQPVPEALALSSMESVFNQVSKVWIVALGLCLLIAMILLEKRLSSLGSFSLMTHVGELLGVFTIVLAYAGVWALLGRIFRHDGRFLGHCVIIILTLISLHLGEYLLQWLLFNLNISSWQVFLEFLLAGGIVLFLLRSSLFLATHLKGWGAHLIALFPALLLIAFGAFTQLSEISEFRAYPKYSHLLFSPDLQLNQVVSKSQYLEQSRKVFDFESVQE
ncbi:FHA domain-containing protein [Motiliproteus sp. MSK22-1]|uniref:FHA domain-containing protein n=1 Tax=Motiliproteus sp. MSK22-1 TaxID=1897630 RepID=UPI000976384D|nr:FHA domain-containing protein [Motiliproteus sp. MSK22-1]OMH28377.1 hypothetical protein BGP75_20980 [Motiliproteus sp. MSK22-1]